MALIICCGARPTPPLLPSEGGEVINCNSTNDGSAETVDGSRASAPKEEPREVKTGRAFWWCWKIIIGVASNSREEIQPSPDCCHKAAKPAAF